MGQYVIRFGLGVDNNQTYLTDTGPGYATGSTPRKARQYESRKAAVAIQDYLLALKPDALNRILRKPVDYADHLSISVISQTNPHAPELNVRHKLYTYPNQESCNV